MVAWISQVFRVPGAWDAATIHIYAGLPGGVQPSASKFRAFLEGAFDHVESNAHNAAAEIPTSLRIWVTELGTYGAAELDFSYLQGLYKLLLSALLPRIPQVDLVLPYCLVCGDSTAPAFHQVNGSWVPTVSGQLHTVLFDSLQGAKRIAPLNFSAGFVSPADMGDLPPFFGWAAFLDSGPSASAAVLINLSPNSVAFNLQALFGGLVKSFEWRVLAPPRGSLGQMLVPHAPVVETHGLQDAHSAIIVPAFAACSAVVASPSSGGGHTAAFV